MAKSTLSACLSTLVRMEKIVPGTAIGHSDHRVNGFTEPRGGRAEKRVEALASTCASICFSRASSALDLVEYWPRKPVVKPAETV